MTAHPYKLLTEKCTNKLMVDMTQLATGWLRCAKGMEADILPPTNYLHAAPLIRQLIPVLLLDLFCHITAGYLDTNLHSSISSHTHIHTHARTHPPPPPTHTKLYDSIRNSFTQLTHSVYLLSNFATPT